MCIFHAWRSGGDRRASRSRAASSRCWRSPARSRDVRLLLLDEPYEGLAPQIVAEIEEILIELKKVGMTVIVVEKNAIAVLRIADTCTILDNGELVFRGEPREVLENRELRRAYLAV
jgi:branched-chain amino acid transport system ATP-binding protein